MPETLHEIIRLMAADIDEMLEILRARDAAIAAADKEFLQDMKIVPEF